MNDLFGDALDDMPREDEILVEDQMAIANWIDEELSFYSMKKGELAEKLGVSPSQVSQILSGCQNMTLKTLAKISAALGRRVISVTPSRPELSAEIQAPAQSIEIDSASVSVRQQTLGYRFDTVRTTGLHLIRGGLTPTSEEEKYKTGPAQVQHELPITIMLGVGT